MINKLNLVSPRLQGYKVSSEGVVETEDEFLRRQCGVVRLYAAVISTPQLPIEKVPHPHGLDQGWVWLARVLNMEPHPSITAAALGSFLEVSVSDMQFFVLNDLQNKFVPAKCDMYTHQEPVTHVGWVCTL